MGADNDRLNQLFEAQKQLMVRYAVPTLKVGMREPEEKLLTKHTLPILLAMLDELHEFLRELNWKPWRKTRKTIDIRLVQDELVDCWHFMLELSLMWGLDADQLIALYEQKHAVNHQRQDKGY